MSPETLTLYHFLKIYISLFLGVVCTSSASLFLLVWITNNSHISIDSLHHDFQTVYVLTTDQWSRDPQLRTAIELRWLWASLSIVLAVGLFPNERAKKLFGLLVSAKLYIRTRQVVYYFCISPTLTVATELGTDQLQMWYAMDLSPCIYPNHQSHFIVKHPRSHRSSASRHSLLPFAPESPR